MSNVKLTDENRKIKEDLIWNFKNTKLTMNLDRDIVNLVAEMTMQAIQMTQNSNEKK